MKLLLGASHEGFPCLCHFEKNFAVHGRGRRCQHSTLVGVLFERQGEPRNLDLSFKLYTDTVRASPDHAARPRNQISIDHKIERSRDRTTYLQMRACVRKIVHYALGRIAVFPPRKAAPQNPLARRASAIWSVSAVVADVS
jgi:hypothetical protein